MALFKVRFQRFGNFCGVAITNWHISTQDPEEIAKIKGHKLFGNGIDLISDEEEKSGSHEPHMTYKELVKTPKAQLIKVNPFEELFTEHELELIRSLDSTTKETIRKNIRAILDDRFNKSGEDSGTDQDIDNELIDDGEDISALTPAIPGKDALPPDEIKEQDAAIFQKIKEEGMSKEVLSGKSDLLEEKSEYELRLILEGLEDENHQPIQFDPDAQKEVLIGLIQKYEALRENSVIKANQQDS